MKRRARWTLWLEGMPALGLVTFTLEDAARRASAEHGTVSHTGEAEVPTLDLEVLLATKLRALYQRRKGRDLFDLHVSVNRFPALDPRRVLSGFRAVMEKEGHPVSWREFEINLNDKVEYPGFKEDIQPLLAEGAFDPAPAWANLAPRLQAAWGSE